MKKVSVLVYEDVVLSSVAGLLDLFYGANELIAKSRKGSKSTFVIELVSEKLKNIQVNMHGQFICTKTMADVTRTDLVIVPPFSVSPEIAFSKNDAILKYLQSLNLKKVEVASLCLGSYFLAEAGLLSGKEATSHWMAIDDMKKRYPKINILSDVVITDYNGIYTSGGAFSSLNLIIYLIEKFSGREAAIQLSKQFSIDMDRVSQAHFAVFRGQRNHNDQQIHNAQTFMEKHYNQDISIEQIAQHTNMSKRNFIRRFKDATRNNPLEYLQRVKIESAKKAIERGEKNMLSIMYDTGYNDLKTFRTIFKRITGLTPQEYMRKYATRQV